jgi:hypothetical protein
MESSRVFAQLSVRVEGRQVLAKLEFVNRSNEDLFIEKFNACFNGEIENNVFRITTDGRTLNYVGILAKRRRPIGEDYLRIEPGQSYTTQTDLVKAYAFLQGSRLYEGLYSAMISYPRRDGCWSLESNKSTFRYTK